jgi:uncharacterized protein (TIGR03089 family)
VLGTVWPMTLFHALAQQTRRLGDQPAVVFHDADTGERTELGFATLHNWVSKTANLFLDAFDAGLGAEVRVDLPLHWMAPVVALGAWATGAGVRVAPGGDVHVAHEADGGGEADLLIGGGMGGRLLGGAAGDALTITDVLGQPDEFVDDPGDEGAWAIGGRTQATLLGEAAPGEAVRVMHAGDRTTEDVLFMLARTLPAGVGVVLARGFDPAGLQAIASQEAVTA